MSAIASKLPFWMKNGKWPIWYREVYVCSYSRSWTDHYLTIFRKTFRWRSYR